MCLTKARMNCVFYRLEEGESFGPLTVKAPLTSTDWAVLNLVALNDLRTIIQVEEEPSIDAAAEEFPSLPVGLRSPKKVVSNSMWQMKSGASGRWVLPRHPSRAEEPLDEFVLSISILNAGYFRPIYVYLG